MDDEPALSAHALAALREFMQEREQKKLEVNDENVAEDWGLSQFWYDEATSQLVAAEILRLIHDAGSSAASVACLACPSLFIMLKKLCPGVRAQLLEYDRRFARHGSEYTYYDYNHPEDLPGELSHSFRVVVVDPPYLSEECLEKTNQAVQFLAEDTQSSRVILLTGSVQQERAFSGMGVRPCNFRPSHKKKLGNEFKIFTNYDPEEHLGGWEAFSEPVTL